MWRIEINGKQSVALNFKDTVVEVKRLHSAGLGPFRVIKEHEENDTNPHPQPARQ